MVKTQLEHVSNYLKINVLALILAELLELRASYVASSRIVELGPRFPEVC